MVIDSSFWKGRKVFMTGYTGFKGSWLSLWLNHLGAEVTGYALSPPTVPSIFDVAEVGQSLQNHINGDIRDLVAITKSIQDVEPAVLAPAASVKLKAAVISIAFVDFPSAAIY